MMDSTGVRRLQIVSSIGIGNSYDQCKKLSFVFSRIIMPYVIARTVKDLKAAETFLLEEAKESRSSELQCVIVRPPGLGDMEGTGEYDPLFETSEPKTYTGPGKYGGGGPLLPRSDVALAMVDMVEDEELFQRHVGKPVSLLPAPDEDTASAKTWCSIM